MDREDDFDVWAARARSALEQGWLRGPGPDSVVQIERLDVPTIAVGWRLGVLPLREVRYLIGRRADLGFTDPLDDDVVAYDDSLAIALLTTELEWEQRQEWYSRIWRDCLATVLVAQWSAEYDPWSAFGAFLTVWGDQSGPLGELRPPRRKLWSWPSRADRAVSFREQVDAVVASDVADACARHW